MMNSTAVESAAHRMELANEIRADMARAETEIDFLKARVRLGLVSHEDAEDLAMNPEGLIEIVKCDACLLGYHDQNAERPDGIGMYTFFDNPFRHQELNAEWIDGFHESAWSALFVGFDDDEMDGYPPEHFGD